MTWNFEWVIFYIFQAKLEAGYFIYLKQSSKMDHIVVHSVLHLFHKCTSFFNLIFLNFSGELFVMSNISDLPSITIPLRASSFQCIFPCSAHSSIKYRFDIWLLLFWSTSCSYCRSSCCLLCCHTYAKSKICTEVGIRYYSWRSIFGLILILNLYLQNCYDRCNVLLINNPCNTANIWRWFLLAWHNGSVDDHHPKSY